MTNRTPRADGLPCSRAQEAVWFAEQVADIGAANNLPLAIDLRGALDVEALGGALQAVVRNEPALRTRFRETNGRLVRTVLDPGETAAAELRIEDAVDTEAIIDERSRVPLDLLRAPFTMSLLRSAQDRHVLFANFHHAVFDGTSKDIFTGALARAYAAVATGREPPRGCSPDHSAYVALERSCAVELEPEAQEYWATTLRTLRDSARFPRSAHAADVTHARGEALRFAIDGTLKRRLDERVMRHGLSLFVLLMAVVQVLQRAYADRADPAIATLIPLGTRPAEFRETIGLFVNEVPLCAVPEARASFLSYAYEVNRRARELFRLRLFPFNEAIARFGPARNPHDILPNFSMSYRKTAAAEFDAAAVRMTADRLLPVYGRRWGARFRFLDEQARVVAAFEYDSALVHDAAAKRIVDQFQTLLTAIATEPETRLGDLSPIPDSERRKLVATWNATKADHRVQTIQELVEAQVERTPDAAGVRHEGSELTYRQLNERANRLAHRLVALGVGPDVPVALYLERGLRLPIAILGIAKAGGGHVPLDPAYPAERLAFMLDDSRAAIVVTQRALVDGLPADGRTMLCMEDVDGGPQGRCENPPVTARPDTLAYVVYTSGSTGVPKGAELLQRGVVNVIETLADAPGLTADDVFLSVTTLSFDIGTVELLAPLAVGAAVVIAPSDVAGDGEELTRLLRDSGATVMFATPSRWRLAVDGGWEGPQKVIVGGEPLSQDVAADLLRRGSEVWNIYGPTETTVFSTRQRIGDAKRVSIGRPVANTRLYVVGPDGDLVPTGVPGELWIAGDGVARGYLNRARLTAERFADDPFEPAGGRLYKSGDLVRYRDDGQLDFLGRIDQQVKIRGFRVEPGEVEAALTALSAVRQAAVVATDDGAGKQRLVAYVVGPRDHSEIRELRGSLARRLPDFMIPSAFVTLEELPLNANGKVDRARLPPPREPSSRDVERVEPRTPTEKALASIWQDVLGVQDVGAEENFFELGGHSLLAAEVVAQARRRLDRSVPMRVVFSAPTIGEMARAIDRGRRSTQEETIPRAARRPLGA